MIHVDNVSKIYNQGKREVTALSEIFFTLNDRESLVIMGKSGSGKSTLLHLVASLSRVKKPVIGFSMRRITFSIRVDLPHRGGPVTRIFFDVI